MLKVIGCTYYFYFERSENTMVNISIPRLGKGMFVEYGGKYEEGEFIMVTLQKFETFQVQFSNKLPFTFGPLSIELVHKLHEGYC